MNTTPASAHLEAVLDRLEESGVDKCCQRTNLPSWRETVTVLDDLHRLLLVPPDRDRSLQLLAHVDRALRRQVEACLPTPGDASRAAQIAERFTAELPGIRQALLEDTDAALDGDPAVTDRDEIIICYPGLRALAYYRMAHALHTLDTPLLPRLITEIAHGETGIDIHPAARIGRRFFIDHGTGVVIGATCIIGNDVKVYQGVTLGAKSFPKADDGQIIKGLDRHPVIGDRVTIYAGATILGRTHIGHDSVIGGNVWVTRDVPPNSHVMQRRPRQDRFIHGAGI